ncbi:MAG: 5'-nucleotidase C-terminal domain-containing protein [Clostridia bacterium]|nr:5'-nucleotidase C-terminal domain-containing protein [Clostridia bacterium]MBR1685074.1 5'-nucleotidase C-terminal domain-containing protein [Clostridia bacterium]
MKRSLSLLLSLAMLLCLALNVASASTFTDAHGNTIELDESLEAYTDYTLVGNDQAARKAETNLGDLWTDALRWFATSGTINDFFEEDDVTAGITSVDADEDHIVALWNGGNLRADIPEGKFGAEALAEVLPYPNSVAVVYMTGSELLEALEAASQGLPYSEESADACASFMQVSGFVYTVDTGKAYDALEPYGNHWFTAGSVSRVSIQEVNGQPWDAEAIYAVITNNANFNGMDSSYVFKAAAEARERSTITTAGVRDVIWSYISEVLENHIGESYAQTQGRILVEGN